MGKQKSQEDTPKLKSAETLVRNHCSTLNVPKNIENESLRMIEETNMPLNNINKPLGLIVSGSIYLASRKMNYPLSITELSESTGFDESDILDSYRIIRDDIEAHFEQVNPHKYVNKYCEILSCDCELEHNALQMTDAAIDDNLHVGRSSPVIAGSAIYAAVHELGYGPTQEEISDNCSISKASIQKLYEKLVAVNSE